MALPAARALRCKSSPWPPREGLHKAVGFPLQSLTRSGAQGRKWGKVRSFAYRLPLHAATRQCFMVDCYMQDLPAAAGEVKYF